MAMKPRAMKKTGTKKMARGGMMSKNKTGMARGGMTKSKMARGGMAKKKK